MNRPIPRVLPPLLAAAALLLSAPLGSAQCTDDAFEDNDACGQATLVPNNWTASLTCVNLDDDYFTAAVPAGYHIQVDLTFANSWGDLDLYLYDQSCGSILASSTSVTDDESVTWENTSGATQMVVARVHMFAPNPDVNCNDYGMTISSWTTLGCQDENEEGAKNNDTCGEANLVFPEVVYLDLGVLTGDPDYWTLTVPAGATLYVDLTFTHALGDIDLQLWDQFCMNVLASATSVTDHESLQWTNPSGFDAVVNWRVYLLPGSDCNQYHMIASIETPDCGPDDGFEENDSCAQAAPIPAGTYVDLMVDDADEDFYRVTVPAGNTVDVDALFSDVDGDVDLYLWDGCGGAVLASSTSTSDDEHVAWTNSSGGPQDVIVRVILFVPGTATGCNRYDLDVELVSGEPGTSYCTSLPNSTGQAATISAIGTASVAANDLVFRAGPLQPTTQGLFVYSPDPDQVPLGNGILCVGNQTLGFVLRLPSETSDAQGFLTHAFDNTAPPHPLGTVTPGSTWFFTCWFRDPPAGGSLFNFSDGYQVLFTP